MSKKEEEEKHLLCPFCDKKFSNGKALGGHKRIHMNKSESQVLKCPVWDEAFVSKKSFYGHIRNHPERAWRQTKPSILTTKNVCFPNDVLVRGWSKTGTRSRNAKSSMRIKGSYGTSCDLEDLRNGEPGRENLPPKKRILGFFVSSSSEGTEEDDNQENRESKGSKKMKGLLVVDDDDKLANLEPKNSRKMKDLLLIMDTSGSIEKERENEDKKANPKPESSKKMKDLLVVIDTSRSNGKGSQNIDKFTNIDPKSSKKTNELLVVKRRKYVCDICARSFKSYQALGGHKAHHNRKADKIRQDNESSTESGVSLVHESPFFENLKRADSWWHKRHFRGPENRDPPNVSDFDLNEFPPEWMPE